MHFLVSGAAGFIGSHLCDRLIAEGHSVTAIDNLITGFSENLEQLSGNPRFRFYEHDITQPFDQAAKFDCVMHLASLASPKHYFANPIATLESGSTGTRNMLEIARRDDARFLLTSTSECYGDPEVHPQVETYWGNVNPVGVRSCYDESKRYAEAMTMAYHRVHGVRTTIARIFNTYGPRMALDDGRVVPAFIDQALSGEPLTVYGDGSQTRSFCYVRDLVDGLLRLLFSEERYPVNLGNPDEMTILEFAQYIRDAVNPQLPFDNRPLPQDDPRRRRPDITKAKSVLNWEPKVSLEEGIRETIAYFRARNGGSAAGTRTGSTGRSAAAGEPAHQVHDGDNEKDTENFHPISV
ncbi:MAG: SDR family oxidoreductase [Candidatus Solibacter usitatus]|nr:SDR family oxidoreductase [Candidatus Solibacter usitatus]